MLFCLQLNVLNIYIQMLSDCTLIMIYRNKMAREWNYMNGKTNTIKGIYLSKALTCMTSFLYKQELFFCQGDGYLLPHCCMNNLYISHRSLYTPTYSF